MLVACPAFLRPRDPYYLTSLVSRPPLASRRTRNGTDAVVATRVRLQPHGRDNGRAGAPIRGRAEGPLASPPARPCARPQRGANGHSSRPRPPPTRSGTGARGGLEVAASAPGAVPGLLRGRGVLSGSPGPSGSALPHDLVRPGFCGPWEVWPLGRPSRVTHVSEKPRRTKIRERTFLAVGRTRVRRLGSLRKAPRPR